MSIFERTFFYFTWHRFVVCHIHIHNKEKYKQKLATISGGSYIIQQSMTRHLELKISLGHRMNPVSKQTGNIVLKCLHICWPPYLDGKVSWVLGGQEPHISEVVQCPNGRVSRDSVAQEWLSSEGKLPLLGSRGTASLREGITDWARVLQCNCSSFAAPKGEYPRTKAQEPYPSSTSLLSPFFTSLLLGFF